MLERNTARYIYFELALSPPATEHCAGPDCNDGARRNPGGQDSQPVDGVGLAANWSWWGIGYAYFVQHRGIAATGNKLHLIVEVRSGPAQSG